MASIFGHGMVAFTLSKILQRKEDKLLIILAVVSAILPDVDVLTFNFGIPYEHPFGHRGFTHSILFAFLWSSLVNLFFAKNHKIMWFVVIFLSTISHGILDAMTSGGRGVGFFVPFDNSRLFFPFRPILVSPLGIERFFSEWGLQVILSEFKYVFLPCFLIFGLRFLIKPAK